MSSHGQLYPVPSLRYFIDMSNDNILWTGSSVFCTCGHHVEHHFTKIMLTFQFEEIRYCSFRRNGKGCYCKEFSPYIEFPQEDMNDSIAKVKGLKKGLK